MRTKWTYKIERIKYPMFANMETKNDIEEEALNRRGLEGWELVQALRSVDGTSMNFYLKKPG